MQGRVLTTTLIALLVLAPSVQARSIGAGEWESDAAGARAREGRLSTPVPATISTALTTRELRELSFNFGDRCSLDAELSVDGEPVDAFGVRSRPTHREISVRGVPGEHAVALSLDPRACGRGRAVLESSSLRERIPIGSEISARYVDDDQDYERLLSERADAVTLGNDLQWVDVEPQRGQFDFKGADHVVDLAERSGQLIRGHPLVWDFLLPGWLRKGRWTRAELIEVMYVHITTIVSRYRGRIAEWDVVNEAVGEGGRLERNIWRETIGPDYIGLAFQFAHAADPEARLYYNEINADVRNQRSDTVYEIVTTLIERGVPIHGVGFQNHVTTGEWHRADDLTDNFRRFAKLGLSIQISEMDVVDYTEDPSDPERRRLQADAYENAARACRREPACARVMMWGLTDRYSWLGTDKEPLPFDRFLEPKPAWRSLTDTLRPRG